MQENYNCENYEDSICLCHKKCDCVNQRIEETFDDIMEMSKELDSEQSKKLRANYKNRLLNLANRSELD